MTCPIGKSIHTNKIKNRKNPEQNQNSFLFGKLFSNLKFWSKSKLSVRMMIWFSLQMMYEWQFVCLFFFSLSTKNCVCLFHKRNQNFELTPKIWWNISFIETEPNVKERRIRKYRVNRKKNVTAVTSHTRAICVRHNTRI